MTEAEIEKQAEEYAKNIISIAPKMYDGHKKIIMKESYKDGAKWGMEHSTEWHDLRENPNDLPKCAENQQIIFYVQEYYKEIEKYKNHYCLGFYKKSFLNDDVKLFVERSKGYECEHLPQEVKKWCYLPQFNDKE